MIKSFFWFVASVLVFSSCQKPADEVQNQSSEEVVVENRPSPPVRNEIEIDGALLTVDFSSPGVKGRQVWDALVPNGEVWRTGANEATWISFTKDLILNEEKVPAGKYGLFTIPQPGEWTIILNKTWDQWGAYEYDSKKDLIRFTIPTFDLEEQVERLNLEFVASEDSLVSAHLLFAWEGKGFKIPISIDN